MSVHDTPETGLGCVTASRIADVIARTKSGWGASRANYRAELVAERLTGFKTDSYTSPAMERGSAIEDDARMAYEFRANVAVAPSLYVGHPSIALAGATPDGFVGSDGLVEIKSPNTATHIDTLLGASLPDRYAVQIQWQLACTGRSWCDFVSFDPRMPEATRFYVRRVPRDDNRIAELEDAVREFLTEVDQRIAALNAKYSDGPSPLRGALEQSILMAG